MKGYLHKTEQGWIVVYDKDDGIDGFLLLHPHNVAIYSFGFYNGKEVDFKMSEEYLDGNNIFTYAEIIMKENDENDIEKLAEEVYGKGVVPDYEEGFTDGYNKAKETMYTQEDLCEAFHAHNDTWIDYEEWFKQFKK